MSQRETPWSECLEEFTTGFISLHFWCTIGGITERHVWFLTMSLGERELNAAGPWRLPGTVKAHQKNCYITGGSDGGVDFGLSLYVQRH